MHTFLTRFRRLVPLAFAWTIALAPGSAAARTTDVVVLDNGDVLHGEVKQLRRGILDFKTPATETISIKWENVAQVTTGDFHFLVEVVDGTKYFGTLAEPEEDFRLRVVSEEAIVGLPMIDVVLVTPIKRTFWSRVKASVSLGFSFTKASDVGQLTFSGTGSYRVREYKVDLSASTIITTQSDDQTSRRGNLGGGYMRFFTHKLYANGTLNFEHNDELGLDLRTSLAGTGGVGIVQTNASLLTTGVGLSANREVPSGGVAPSFNAEGIVSATYALFVYHTPKTDLTLDLAWFPSITVTGRHRMDFETKLRWELVKNLFWDLTFYDNFDSKPSSGQGATNDYGIVTGIGWTY